MTTNTKKIDWGGLTLIANELYLGATKSQSAGTMLSSGGTLTASGTITAGGPEGEVADSAALLKMNTAETTIVVTDQLGRIEFAAPSEASGTDAIVVSASIWAEAEDTFSSTVNATSLVFATGASEVAAEKARINSAGNITCSGSVFPTGGFKSSPVALAADDTTLTILAANSGKVHMIPDLDGTSTATLPAAADGLYYEFVYVGAAADAHNFVIVPTAGFFIGGLLHADVGGTTAAVYSDNNSNDVLTLVTPAAGTRVIVVSDGTNWYVSGYSSSATIPSFADA